MDKKIKLCSLVMAGVLLAGCNIKPVENPELSGTELTQETTTAPEVTNATEPGQIIQPTESETSPAVPQTEPSSEATEPMSPTKEPTTPPTQPATEPPSTKPGDLTKPVTRPTQNTEPQPTEPAATQPPTKPAPTVPEEPQPTHVDLSGWKEQDGKRYYLNPDGSLHTGWLELGNDRYYFHQDGTMAVGKVSVPGSGTRYFTSTGKECILVNPWNYVPEDYTVKLGKHGDYQVAAHCISELEQMLADCRAAGSKAVVVSAYRSHSYQEGLHQRRIQRCLDEGYSYEEAVKEASRHVAVPGTSEHELGLALDIVDVNYMQLDEHQETMPAQKWLMNNSWRYGFILRYPNAKSEVTGITYEPWHYRYVGKELAAELHQSGLCLEEYFQRLTNG